MRRGIGGTTRQRIDKTRIAAMPGWGTHHGRTQQALVLPSDERFIAEQLIEGTEWLDVGIDVDTAEAEQDS